jgi:hypothetical protein
MDKGCRRKAARRVNIINPATEQPAGRISLATSADVDVAVKGARAAFKTLSLRTPKNEDGGMITSPISRDRPIITADLPQVRIYSPFRFSRYSFNSNPPMKLRCSFEALKVTVHI